MEPFYWACRYGGLLLGLWRCSSGGGGGCSDSGLTGQQGKTVTMMVLREGAGTATLTVAVVAAVQARLEASQTQS